MPVTLRQIVRWNEGELNTPAIKQAIASARPTSDDDIVYMDSLAQKLRASLLSCTNDATNEDIELMRSGKLRLNSTGQLWLDRYELAVTWLDEHAPHIKTF